jgi:hypothetical protein
MNDNPIFKTGTTLKENINFALLGHHCLTTDVDYRICGSPAFFSQAKTKNEELITFVGVAKKHIKHI